jgi:hypothetical protein
MLAQAGKSIQAEVKISDLRTLLPIVETGNLPCLRAQNQIKDGGV